MLELTTRFSGITTSPKARNGGLTPAAAAAKAKANLRYITRPSALGEQPMILSRGDFRTPTGKRVKTPGELKASMRLAIDERATRGGERGIRVAEKIIFSLPNDFPPAAQQEALRRIMRRLADGSRDAKLVGTIHLDKTHNLHGHILALDGLETEAQALARRPEAKRVRRREAIRLGERGRPKELRKVLADAINEVAEENGLSRVEYRSFQDRGLAAPTKHEGPTRRAQRHKTEARDPVAMENAERRKVRSQARRKAAEASIRATGKLAPSAAPERGQRRPAKRFSAPQDQPR